MSGKRQIARNLARWRAIEAKYRASDEAMAMPGRSTADLIALHRDDREWLRRGCGDMEIDGGICARHLLAGEILAARGIPFRDGGYQETP